LARHLLLPALLLIGVSGCGPSYSPDTYSTNAVQQANKAEQGVVVGVRPVSISATGAVGTVTGAAAGGIAGAQVGVGPVTAFSALGGSLVGGLAGSAMEHATSDTKAFEYIVRKTSGDLVSVTQKDAVPLVLGERVLVIAGNQARVVPDYTVALPGLTGKPDAAKAVDAKSADNKPTDSKPASAANPAMAGAALPASVSATPLPVPDLAGPATPPAAVAVGAALTAPATSTPLGAAPSTAAPAAAATPAAATPPAVANPVSAALGGATPPIHPVPNP
jgi:outer membrane lipoprotein SlyB